MVLWVVSGNVNATLTGNSQVQITGYNLDAFARLRVLVRNTFFDSALTGERRYDWSSSTATSGTVTFDYNACVRNLNVTRQAVVKLSVKYLVFLYCRKKFINNV